MTEINNLTRVKVDKIFIKKAAQIVLKGESVIRQLAERKKNINLSIAFIGPSRIKNLNKKYRGKNRVTDVLAFNENGRGGEVVICLQKVKKNAKRYASPFEKELINCLIHGILHLLGYNHEKSEKKAKEMKKKQDYYLSQIYG